MKVSKSSLFFVVKRIISQLPEQFEINWSFNLVDLEFCVALLTILFIYILFLFKALHNETKYDDVEIELPTDKRLSEHIVVDNQRYKRK